ncbi:uncharacterized protein LOC121428990 [Lytechinus variegatus]|uniref:uncharacterized protein LOC121428990 n=1 Tax=Lytechinus variegatus TaxID=7654 RepID=UPI001BB25036|nr:uncharacterized protein LOC121428990 [Lytechinus variegatus]
MEADMSSIYAKIGLITVDSLAILLNAATMIVILVNKKLRETRNIFIWNIACSDLLASTIAITTLIKRHFTGDLGRPETTFLLRACYLTAVCSALSVAIQRFIVLRFDPFNTRNLVTARKCIIVCFLFWTCTIMAMYFNDLFRPVGKDGPGLGGPGGSHVRSGLDGLDRAVGTARPDTNIRSGGPPDSDRSDFADKGLKKGTGLLRLLFPTVIFSAHIVSSVFYAVVYSAIANAARKAGLSGNVLEQRIKQNKKILITFGIVVLTNLSCWLPFCTLFFLQTTIEDLTIFSGGPYSISGSMWIGLVRNLAMILIGLNACLNPIIYWTRITEFRRTLFEILHGCRKCNQKSGSRNLDAVNVRKNSLTKTRSATIPNAEVANKSSVYTITT